MWLVVLAYWLLVVLWLVISEYSDCQWYVTGGFSILTVGGIVTSHIRIWWLSVSFLSMSTTFTYRTHSSTHPFHSPTGLSHLSLSIPFTYRSDIPQSIHPIHLQDCHSLVHPSHSHTGLPFFSTSITFTYRTAIPHCIHPANLLIEVIKCYFCWKWIHYILLARTLTESETWSCQVLRKADHMLSYQQLLSWELPLPLSLL